MTPAEAVQLMDQWIEQGGEFPSFLHHWCSTVEEAQAIVRALELGDVSFQSHELSTPALFGVVACMSGFFPQEADQILREQAVPILRQKIAGAFDDAEKTSWDSCNIFVLKKLAYYGAVEDVELIVKAARLPKLSGHFMWWQILNNVHRFNPAAERVLDELASPLPDDVLRIAYLDFANSMALDHRITKHPFDTPEAVQWLKELFEEEGEVDYLVSAIKSASFLSEPGKRILIAKANSHPRRQFREEAAWALACDPREQKQQNLVEFAKDPRLTTRAIQSMQRMGMEQSIPDVVNEPGHQAMVRMSDWLLNEEDFYGYPPDFIELIDHRQLQWLPTGKEREVWLVRYRCDQDADNDHGYNGIGAVWEDEIEGVCSSGTDLGELYAELLSDSKGFPPGEDPLNLLKRLNPGMF